MFCMVVIVLKDESNTFKKNWIVLLVYLINKHSKDVTASTNKLKVYADSIECDVFEKKLKINIQQHKRNHFYIHRYHEYYEELITVCSGLIPHPKKMNALIN